MATTNAQINVSVNGLSSLDTLDKKLTGLGTLFGGLKTKLATIGLAAFARSALTMADDLTDLSNATSITIGKLIELKTILSEAGLPADAMSNAVTKFTQSIQEAADGSLKTQNNFRDLGISLQDLNTLSEQDLLSKALSGFDRVGTSSEKAAIKMDLFGKSFRTVDPTDFKNKLDAAAGSGDKYAESMRKAAELNDNLATAMTNLKIAFLQVTAPIVNFVNMIAGSGKSIETLVTVIKVLGTILLAVFGGAIAIGVVRFIGLFGRGFMAIGPAIGGVSKWFTSFGAAAEAGAARATLSFAANGKLMTALRGIAAFAGTVGGAILGMFGLGGAKDADKPAPVPAVTDTSRKEEVINRGAIEAIAKKRMEIENITKAFKQQSDQTIQSIMLDERLIGVNADTAEILRAQSEIYKRQQDEIDKLRTAKALLSKDEKALAATYDQQIGKISEQAQKDAQRVAAAISGLQGVRLLEQDRLNNIQRITDALEKQKKLEESMLGIRQSTQSQLDQVGFEKAQMGRNPLEKQFAQIQESARKAALDAGRAFAATFDDTNMSAQDAKRLAEGLDLIAQKYKEIADAQSANLIQSRTWMAGWTDAFNQYVDSATNAANQARDIFNSVTSSMNSAIDKFVDSGKFSFRDLSESIIKDILKIELKAAAAKVFGAMGGLGGAATAAAGGGGFFSSIASLLGFANGGNPPVGKPSIVGEKGPELFIPKTAGTIVPNTGFNSNGQSQQPQNVTYVTNNISALDARSVAQLFAANRKTLLGSVQLAQKELPYGNR